MNLSQELAGNILLLMGLVFGAVGAVLLGLDALGISGFVDALKGEDQHITSLGFNAYVNTRILFIIVDVLALGLIWWFMRSPPVALILCPFAYFVWRAAVRITAWLYYSVALPRFYQPLGEFFKALMERHPLWGWAPGLLVMLPASAILLAFFLLNAIVEFGIVLPSFAFGQFVIKPRMEAALEKVAQWVETQERWHFKGFAYTGMLFLAFGFLYQLFGTLALMFATSKPQQSVTRSQANVPATSGTLNYARYGKPHPNVPPKP